MAHRIMLDIKVRFLLTLRKMDITPLLPQLSLQINHIKNERSPGCQRLSKSKQWELVDSMLIVNGG